MINLVKGATTRERLMQKLQKAYPNAHIKPSEDFNGRDGAIWIGAEDMYDRNGDAVFNYWTENHTKYDLGVIKHFNNFIERNGWYAEWYDAGTVFLYQI